jgi:hypothetical protein
MKRRETTAHGRTMEWSISSRGRYHVLHGYIAGEPRFSCQLLKGYTMEQAERTVIERLKQIATFEAEGL